MRYKFKSFFTVILTVVLALSFVSCSSTEKKAIDSVNPTEETGETLTEAVTPAEDETASYLNEDNNITKKTTPKDKTTQKEFVETNTRKNKANLKEAIEAIIAYEYNGYNKDFIEYDIYNQPERELELIYSTDYFDSCDSSLSAL